jgi:hypothetical protein
MLRFYHLLGEHCTALSTHALSDQKTQQAANAVPVAQRRPWWPLLTPVRSTVGNKPETAEDGAENGARLRFPRRRSPPGGG